MRRNVSVPLMPSRARFIGDSGYMGLVNNRIYVVEIFIESGSIGICPKICVNARDDMSYCCKYPSMKKLLAHWDFDV